MNTKQRKARIREIQQILIRDTLTSRLKKEGDIHLLNVFLFFGKWVEKTDPLRDGIKKVVFGRECRLAA